MGKQAAVFDWKGGAFRSVLVCLDRSRAAEAVLPLAAYVARANDAQLVLFHVLEPRGEGAEARATDALEWEIQRQEARAYLDSVSERTLDLGVRPQCLLSEGPAARCVTEMADEIQADLVVLSRFGEGAATAWNMGGTAQKILALARGAVLIVPPEIQDRHPRVPPQRILVPLDGSLRGESVLPAALHLARLDDAELLLAHVVSDPVRSEVLQAPEDLELAQALADRMVASAEAYLARIQQQLSAAGARASTLVSRFSDHREGLVQLAAVERADLVLLSAHGAVCNPRRRFGSVTAHLIAQATAPVLVLQDVPEPAARSATVEPPRAPPRSLDADARTA